MGFRDEIRRFQAKVDARHLAIHRRSCELVYASIVNGSPLSGAPGQPVDTGNLRASWQQVIEGPLTQRIQTNVVYAPIIEEGTRAGRALTLRSAVGGFHSVALTRAAWPVLLAAATAEVTHGG